MTKEEKKELTATQLPPITGDAANETEMRRQADDTAEEAEIRRQADALRDYSNSPVKVAQPTSHPWQDFVNNRYYQSLQETAAQKAAREKREKNARMIAAITDGLVGLSNMAGAMGGATPIKPTSISLAHKKQVDEAKAIRDANRKMYETARSYALKAQREQDTAQAKLEANELEKRRKAAKDAGGLYSRLVSSKAARVKAEDANALGVARLKQKDKVDNARLGIQQQRVNISAGNAGRQQGKTDEENAAYDYWESLTPEERNKARDEGNRRKTNAYGETVKDQTTGQPIYNQDNKAFILDTYHKHKARSKGKTSSSGGSQQKKTDLRRNARQGSGKKKSAI